VIGAPHRSPYDAALFLQIGVHPISILKSRPSLKDVCVLRLELRSRSDPRPQRLPGKICHLARVVEPPHHVGSYGHQAEFRPLLFREVCNAIAELLEYAAIVSERFHRPDLNHPSLVA
jgi:hypothetical protein